MPEQLVITEVEVAKELPDWQGKGAKVYRYIAEGDERQPEDFVVNGSDPKKVGDTVEIEKGEYGWKVKKAPRGGKGGYRQKMDPEERKQVHRQSAQERALLRERNIIAAGGRPFTGEQLRSVINWFEEDINTKDRAIKWDGFSSDIPVDIHDFDPKAA